MQHAVPLDGAEPLVEQGEPVDINQSQRERISMPFKPLDLMIEGILKISVIEKACQTVGKWRMYLLLIIDC